MPDPRVLTPSAVDIPAPELREAIVNEDATALGQEVKCVVPSHADHLTTDPLPWSPVTTAEGEFWPKKGDRAQVAFPPDGPPVIHWWAPSGGATADRPIGAGGGSDKHYEHNQEVASKEWTIAHGLGKEPAVTAFDTTDQEIGFQQVPVDSNTVILRFNIDISGRAVLN
jgi:hypothetical protein